MKRHLGGWSIAIPFPAARLLAPGAAGRARSAGHTMAMNFIIDAPGMLAGLAAIAAPCAFVTSVSAVAAGETP